MNFYTKVLSTFATTKGLRLTVTVGVAPDGGVSKQAAEQDRAAKSAERGRESVLKRLPLAPTYRMIEVEMWGAVLYASGGTEYPRTPLDRNSMSVETPFWQVGLLPQDTVTEVVEEYG